MKNKIACTKSAKKHASYAHVCPTCGKVTMGNAYISHMKKCEPERYARRVAAAERRQNLEWRVKP